MNINYNVTGKPRKRLVEAIAKTMDLEDEVKYLGAPSYAYQIGDDFIVDRSGIVTLPDLPEDLASQPLVDLKALGFEPEGIDAPTKEAEVPDTPKTEQEYTPEHKDEPEHESEPEHADSAEHADGETTIGSDLITVSIKNDLAGDEEERLLAIIESKHTLLCHALQTDELPVNITKDVISFPWFKSTGIEGEAIAYAQLITGIVKMTKTQKRVNAKDKQEENEKFAMRIFLVRLGLKGDEFKLIRKLMSRNLTGNSSWRYGKPDKAAKAAENGADGPTEAEVAALPPEAPATAVDGETSNTETEVNTIE